MGPDPNLTVMDARAYLVAVLFGFAGGLLVPRAGPDRKALQVTIVLMVALGTVAWLFYEDVYAGPSLTVGAISALLGTLVRRGLTDKDQSINAR